MTTTLLPATWLITLIVGLPQLAETVYTPSLPDIAHALNTSESMVEYTLTIYLLSFAIGTFFWGIVSDKFGRKPCVVSGLFIFILGCLSCYLSTTIEMLLLSRFIQGLGGSIGSVLGQAICRDAFHGPDIGKIYASIASALALFLAIGPVIGGFIAENYGWSNIFVFLMIFTLFLNLIIINKLPETHVKSNWVSISIREVISAMLRDKKVIGYSLIIGGCSGIAFSYYAEGSFYLIEQLDLSPSKYGLSFILIALSASSGALISKRLLNKYESKTIMGYGLILYICTTSIFSFLVIIHSNFYEFPKNLMVVFTILNQMIVMCANCLTSSNALAVALVDYKRCIGTSSSFFGCFYYIIASLITFGIGSLHNGTLLVMPLYFLSISIFMYFVNKILIKQ